MSVDLRGDNSYSPDQDDLGSILTATNQGPDILTPRFNRFFLTHERVLRKLGSFNFATLQTELLTDEDVDAVRGAMLVESHNPVYTEGILGYFRGHPDEQEMTAFTEVWGYEELRHYLILLKYLEASGKVDRDELAADLKVTRAGPWGERELKFSRVQAFVYPMMQEQVTARFYRRFAEVTQEPLLQDILRAISKDEYRHCQYYLAKGREELALGGNRIKEACEAIIGFYMPGDSFIGRYKERVLDAGNRVAPFDIGAMGELVDKVRQLVGRWQFTRLAMDPALHRRLGDEFNIDPMAILRSKGKIN